MTKTSTSLLLATLLLSTTAHAGRFAEMRTIRRAGLMKEYRAERTRALAELGYTRPTLRGVATGAALTVVAGTLIAGGAFLGASTVALAGASPKAALHVFELSAAGFSMPVVMGGIQRVRGVAWQLSEARARVIERHGLGVVIRSGTRPAKDEPDAEH